MHLTRRICSLLFLATGAGCHEATGPSPQVPSRFFVLESIAGRNLPAIISAGAGETTQVIWSTVTLDSAGGALTVHHFSQAYLQYPHEETTSVLHQEYRMKGDSIEIGGFKPCPPGAMCAGNLHGSLVDSTLAIAEWYNPYPSNPVIYRYHLVQSY